jgi:DMSO/TMAO reductase YedYZ heme-binding membrane subunit
MPYINDGDGKLNNFAREPQMYQSEPMSSVQKRNYLIVGIVGSLLVLGLVVVSFTVS